MNKPFLFVIVSVLALLAIPGLTACNTPQPITGAERDAVLAYAEPKTDNLLQGYNSGDYAVFARDFDAAMAKAETEAVFTATRTVLMSKIGAYVSRQVSSVFIQDNFVVVLYAAKFEQAEGVTVRIVFEPGGTHPIAGLWFNSPKLN